MARAMTFSLGGHDYTVEPAKIDRRALYGWTEVRAFDDAGRECNLVSTDGSGTVIIPKDGIALGLMSNGRWVERRELRTVTAEGQDATLVPSSYGRVNQLADKATDEEFLDCSITGFYHLPGADPALVAAVGDDIYRFDYCYLDSYEPSPAFVLAAPAGGVAQLFLFVGTPGNFEFVGLNEVGVADEDDTSPDEGDDDIDFGMF